MLQKTIHRNIGNPETNRLYRFTDQVEMDSVIGNYKKNFTRSVTILDSGKFNSTKANFINTIATETWDDLLLNQDDFFLFTRENLNLKKEDEKRKEKLAKRGTFAKVPETTLQSIKTRKSNWTEEEMTQLWSGTIKEVAEKLNKSYAIVYGKRKQYEEQNPTFIIPDCAIYKKEKKDKTPTVIVTKKAEKPVKIVYKQTIAELTNAETDIMWKHSSMELRAQYPHIFKSIFIISALRAEYCKLHPEFIIPLSAKFNPAGLPNKVETKVRAKTEIEPIVTKAKTIQETIVKQVTEKTVAQPTAHQNTMAEMFTLLTASGMKPKKATFTKDGEVSFEF